VRITLEGLGECKLFSSGGGLHFWSSEFRDIKETDTAAGPKQTNGWTTDVCSGSDRQSNLVRVFCVLPNCMGDELPAQIAVFAQG
jgi:hypothetical protein